MERNGKKIILAVSNKFFIGDAIFEDSFDDSGNKTFSLAGLSDTWVFDIIHVPVPAQNELNPNQPGLAIVSQLVGFYLGNIVDIPDNAIISEASPKSKIYEEYVRLSANIAIPKSRITH